MEPTEPHQDPYTIKTAPYVDQKKRWPKWGKHILAQYTDDAILVYQAYNRTIAKHAVENQKFSGCIEFNPSRMTWIKTNFLWMMYRSNWGKKDKNQASILGIWLKREAFERILAHMVHSGFKQSVYGSTKNYNSAVSRANQQEYGFVRLQWDPDHHPNGKPHPGRRAIQLGLKKVKSFVSGEDILKIIDISDFVAEQYVKILTDELVIPEEHVYPLPKELADSIMLDEWDGEVDDGVDNDDEVEGYEDHKGDTNEDDE